MATQDYHLAAPQPVLLRFDDDAGDPITDMGFQIRLNVGDACEAVTGVVDGTSYAFDLSAMDLSPRPYLVSVYYSDGSGWTYNAYFILNVIGGC